MNLLMLICCGSAAQDLDEFKAEANGVHERQAEQIAQQAETVSEIRDVVDEIKEKLAEKFPEEFAEAQEENGNGPKEDQPQEEGALPKEEAEEAVEKDG